MRVRAVVALLPMLLELFPSATAAEEAALPAAFLEFLAEMVEEDGELLDPLLLAPPPLEDDAWERVGGEAPANPSPGESPLPAGGGEMPEAAPEADLGRPESGARGIGAPGDV